MTGAIANQPNDRGLDEGLRCLSRGGPTSRRIVCFPPAGVGASSARLLAPSMPLDCELLAVQLPGREDRYAEVPFGSVHEAASAVARALAGLPKLPTTFFGHSFGAIIAFETARHLSTSRELRMLAVAGHDAPCIARYPRGWHRLDAQSLITALRALGGTHEAVLDHDELMRLALPVIRNDLRMLDEYAYRLAAPLPLDVTALAGDADTLTTHKGIDAWRLVTSGTFSSQWLPGGHFFPSLHIDTIVRLLIGSMPVMESVR